jgi:hypothetical protein
MVPFQIVTRRMAAANQTQPSQSANNNIRTASPSNQSEVSIVSKHVTKQKEKKKLVSINTAKKSVARSAAEIKRVTRQPKKATDLAPTRHSTRVASRLPQAITYKSNSSRNARPSLIDNNVPVRLPSSPEPITDPTEFNDLEANDAPILNISHLHTNATVNDTPVINEGIPSSSVHAVQSNSTSLVNESVLDPVHAYYEALMKEHDMGQFMTMVRRRIAANEKRELLRAAITGPFWWHELHQDLCREVVRLYLAISAGRLQDHDEAVQLPLEHPFWTGEVPDDNAVSPAA